MKVLHDEFLNELKEISKLSEKVNDDNIQKILA